MPPTVEAAPAQLVEGRDFGTASALELAAGRKRPEASFLDTGINKMLALLADAWSL